MNLYAPIERMDGRWQMCAYAAHTGLHAIGYCAGLRVVPDTIRRALGHTERTAVDDAIGRGAAGHFHTNGHATADDARECYRQYLLDFALWCRPIEDGAVADLGEPFCCYVCDQPARTFAQIGHDWWHAALCQPHATRDTVATMFTLKHLPTSSSW